MSDGRRKGAALNAALEATVDVKGLISQTQVQDSHNVVSRTAPLLMTLNDVKGHQIL